MTREEAIQILKDMIQRTNFYSNHIIDACKIAIASLETDEAYLLEYEQPEFCKDCVPREAVRRIITSPRTKEQMLNALNSLVSVYPKSEFSEVNCNNCKNNLHRGNGTTYCATSDGMCHFESECNAEDCISRERLKQIICNITAEYDTETIHIDRLMDEIENLPSVYPKSEPLTLETAIAFLQETGWMQEHDKALTEDNKVLEDIKKEILLHEEEHFTKDDGIIPRQSALNIIDKHISGKEIK